MAQVMPRVESTIVEFEFHVHVVTARCGIIPAFVQPISGGVAIVDVDRDDNVISAGVAGGLLLCPADLTTRPEVRVQVLLVMGELVFQQVDIGMIHIGRRLKLPVVVRVVLIVLWIVMGWHNAPVGKRAVNSDLLDRSANDNATEHSDPYRDKSTNCLPQKFICTHPMHLLGNEKIRFPIPQRRGQMVCVTSVMTPIIRSATLQSRPAEEVGH